MNFDSENCSFVNFPDYIIARSYDVLNIFKFKYFTVVFLLLYNVVL